MNFIEELNQLQDQMKELYRGKIGSEIESKIRNNVFEIMGKLFSNSHDSSKFLHTTTLMYKDWSQEYSEDIRFGREENANKVMVKLSTFEWILSLPSVQKMRAS